MELGLFLLHVVPGLLLMGHGSRSCSAGSAAMDPRAPASSWTRSACARASAWRWPRASTSSPAALLLALGLLIPLAAVLIASTMLVASLTAHRGKGLWVTNNGFELPLLYGLIAVAPRRSTARASGRSTTRSAGERLAGLGWGLGALGGRGHSAGLTVVGAARHSERGHAHGVPTTS